MIYSPSEKRHRRVLSGQGNNGSVSIRPCSVGHVWPIDYLELTASGSSMRRLVSDCSDRGDRHELRILTY